MKYYTYKDLAAAYVKGCALKGVISLPEGLAQRNLGSLTDDQKDELVSCGKAAGLKMHYFKEKVNSVSRAVAISLLEVHARNIMT